jgi:hypothetical protein
MTREPQPPFPTILDEIVTRNRDRVQIGLATESEVAALAAAVDCGPGEEKDVLNGWRLVAMRHLPSGDTVVQLLGDRVRARGPVITSPVLGLDVERCRARTRNSIYRLASKGQGEPPIEQIIGFCAYLHRRGLGQALGVIDAFF